MASPREVLNVKSRITLKDVLLGQTTAPFDLTSFREFAQKEQSLEHLDFWIAAQPFIEAYQRSRSMDVEACRQFLKEFVYEGATRPVNLGYVQKLNLLHAAPPSPERGSWSKASQKAFFEALQEALKTTSQLIQHNSWSRWMHKLSTSARIHFTTEMAFWCWSYPDKPPFFTYPTYIDVTEYRITTGLQMLLLLATWIAGNLDINRWVVLGGYGFLFYGYLARFLCGPRLCLLTLGVIYSQYYCCLCGIPQFEIGKPRRFEQAVGSGWLGMTAALYGLMGTSWYVTGMVTLWLLLGLLTTFVNVSIWAELYARCSKKPVTPGDMSPV